VRDPLVDHKQNEAGNIVYEVEGVDVSVDKQDETTKILVIFQVMEKKMTKEIKKNSNIEVLVERYLDFRNK
jgi:hypothetical protein